MLVDLSHYADDPERLLVAAAIFEEINGREPDARDYLPHTVADRDAAADAVYLLSERRPATAGEKEAFRRPRELEQLKRLLEWAQAFTSYSERIERMGPELARLGKEIEDVGLELAELELEESSEVVLQLGWGAGGVIDSFEREAREVGVDCRTRVVSTGLLSRRVYFTLTAPKFLLHAFTADVARWAQRNGVSGQAA